MNDPPAASEGSLPAQAGAAGSRVIRARIIQVAAVARSSSAVLVLMIASITSAIAAVIGLQKWVPLIAAITAVISGLGVVRSSLIVPIRIRRAEDATVELAAGTALHYVYTGPCLQIAANRWVTAVHVVRNVQGPLVVKVQVSDVRCEAEVIYSDMESDLAVLATSVPGPGAPKIAYSLPSPDDRIEVVGWTIGADKAIRATLDYVVQTPVHQDSIVVTGPPPPLGFSGAAAIELSTGRTIGILSIYQSAESGPHGRPGTLSQAQIVPLTRLGPEFR